MFLAEEGPKSYKQLLLVPYKTYWVYRKLRERQVVVCRREMLMSVRINDFGLVLMSRRKEEEGNRGEDSTRRHMAEFAGHTRSERRIHDLFHAQHTFRFQVVGCENEPFYNSLLIDCEQAL